MIVLAGALTLDSTTLFVAIPLSRKTLFRVMVAWGFRLFESRRWYTVVFKIYVAITPTMACLATPLDLVVLPARTFTRCLLFTTFPFVAFTFVMIRWGSIVTAIFVCYPAISKCTNIVLRSWFQAVRTPLCRL